MSKMLRWNKDYVNFLSEETEKIEANKFVQDYIASLEWGKGFNLDLPDLRGSL